MRIMQTHQHGNIMLSGKQRGFSIIEALIAMALIAFAMIPLLVLQGQMTKSTLAMQRAKESTIATDTALGLIKTINPMITPTGEQQIASAILRWESVPVSNLRDARVANGGAGRFKMQLYDINVTITHASGNSTQFTARKMGWQTTEPIIPTS